MSSTDRPEQNRRHDEEGNWFVKAGALTRSVKFILTIFTLLLAASLLYQFTASRDDAAKTQESIDRLKEIAAQGTEQRELILDCTTPEGKCFKEGQQRTADVVANLNIVTQYSVICGEREDGEEAILECVNREVKDFLKVQSSSKP